MPRLRRALLEGACRPGDLVTAELPWNWSDVARERARAHAGDAVRSTFHAHLDDDDAKPIDVHGNFDPAKVTCSTANVELTGTRELMCARPRCRTRLRQGLTALVAPGMSNAQLRTLEQSGISAAPRSRENRNGVGGWLHCDRAPVTATVDGPLIHRRGRTELSKKSFAGAAALLCAPLAVIAAVSIIPTLSDKAGDQVAAVHRHREAMLTGMTLQTVTIVLLVAGTVWLALSLYRHAPRWGFAGGVLGVGGALVVLFIDSVHAGAIVVALNFGPGQATPIVHSILSSRVVSIFEPLQVVQDLGLILLAVAAAKSGVSRWAAASVAVGAVAEGAGFAGGSRPLVGIAFAVMLAGLLPIVLKLAGRGSPQPARMGQPVTT